MHLFSKVLTRVLVLVDFLKIGQHEVYSLDSRREALFSGMAGRHGLSFTTETSKHDRITFHPLSS